ncbi:MAG: DUF4252 domain-containing protein [Acidobacteriota bacterium]|nr:DUF4252 domain-containing protein [Acidobacteriota bacterium]
MNKMIKMAFVMALVSAAGAMANAQEVVSQVTLRSNIEMQTDGSVVRVKQVKDDLFAGTEKFATGATDVTEINLDPKMMGMVHGGNSGELAHKMRYMVIHTYAYDKPGMYKVEDVEAYRKKLEDGTWSCSVHVKEKSGTTDICSRTSSSNEGSEMVILTAEPKELTFIHMSGNMSLDELSHMGGPMGGGSHHRAPMAPVAPVPPTPPTAPTAPMAPVVPK